MRQTDRTSWTVAAWLPAERCYGAQVIADSAKQAAKYRDLLVAMGNAAEHVDMWETRVRVLRGSGA